MPYILRATGRQREMHGLCLAPGELLECVLRKTVMLNQPILQAKTEQKMPPDCNLLHACVYCSALQSKIDVLTTTTKTSTVAHSAVQFTSDTRFALRHPVHVLTPNAQVIVFALGCLSHS